MAREVKTEAQFVRAQLLFMLKLPWYLLLVVFWRKRFSELFAPFHELASFLLEPKLTIAIILLNVLFFIYEIFFMPASLFESLVFRPEYLLQLNFVPMVASWFMHASLSHLLGNMVVLYIFGRILERKFGYKMLLIYFGAAIISDLVSSLFWQGGIGASGAISGLVAAAILIDPFYITFLVFGIPLPIMLIGWLSILSDVTGILSPEVSNIGYFAHLGGYLSITLLVYLLNREERQRMKKGLIINIVFAVLLALIYYFFK